MTKIACLKCNSRKLYQLKNGKKRCARCRYEFTPHRLPLTFSRDEWKEIIHLFLEEKSSNIIARETGFEQRRVLRALTRIRSAMAGDIPVIFSGSVNLNSGSLNNPSKDKRKMVPENGKNLRHDFRKRPAFGILCRSGKVFAQVIDDTEADSLPQRISPADSAGPAVFPDSWRGYTGIAARGTVQRLTKPDERLFSGIGRKSTDGLEDFWGYLRRKLMSKGGVRRERLHLFLGEYVWMYNHRPEPERIKMQRILRLLENHNGRI